MNTDNAKREEIFKRIRAGIRPTKIAEETGHSVDDVRQYFKLWRESEGEPFIREHSLPKGSRR